MYTPSSQGNMNYPSTGGTEHLTVPRGIDDASSAPLPNPPPRITPRRRENAVQPPALTTSLSAQRFQGRAGGGGGGGGGFMPTPNTTTTMTSPFMPSSSGPLSGMASPMSAHPSSHHTAPYNPQEWGPIQNTSPSAAVGMGVYTPDATPMSAAASRGMPEEAALPPPPYSPPRSTPQAQSAQTVASRVLPNASPSHPQGNASPAQPRFSNSRPRPSSMVYSHDLPSPGLQQQPYPPPPGSGGRRINDHAAYSPSPQYNGRQNGSVDSPGRASPDVHYGTYHGNAMDGVPPGSRRAASTGDIESRGGHVPPDPGSSSRSRRWEPGMPLPPPPPGPPPSSTPTSRRNSMEPSPAGPSTRERPRQAPALGTTLPSIPPTPADWVDSDSNVQQPSTPHENARPSSAQNSSDVRGEPSSSRAASIRERRIESRQGRNEHPPSTHDDAAEEASTSDPSWPADLVLNNNTGGRGLVRRRTLTRASPRSARSNPTEEQRGSGISSASPYGQNTSSTGSFPTPKERNQSSERERQGSVQTPPFSPGREPKSPSAAGETSRSLPPKTLPTPPLNVHREASPRSGGNDRPISHLLHLPVDASPTNAPLVPKTHSSPGAQQLPDTPEDAQLATPRDETFWRNAEARYRDFLARESEASGDEEALKTFCDFMILESALRRRRYDSVWVSRSFDQESVGSKLFVAPPPPPEERRSANTDDGQIDQPPAAPSAQHNQAPPSPHARPQPRLTVDPSFSNQYKPTLSPIASMSMGDDEQSSRGRAHSRWWESQTGSESGSGNGRPAPRSKRETKYMGLPREMREAMQFQVSGSIPEHEVDNSTFPASNPFTSYGPNEYPPEKVGWHEDQSQMSLRRAPSNSREKLDISRLVTLPPPYPRHYPAVNNNHPDLSFYRSTVRSVSDLSELKSTKQEYQRKVEELREKHEQRLQDERRSFKTGVNQGIEEGSISYADAAEAEAIRRTEEREQEKELVQAEFDLYQERVLKPMRSILSDRVNIVSTCIDELRGKLFDSAQHETPNQTQEGGDEQPELLEKLTQLKWLFEARENLYREEFDIKSEHSEKYRKLVTLPYHQTNNREKIQETDGFFTRDSQDQRLTFTAESLQRLEGFLQVIEDNVSRGVETQLSAFWDIAPSLLDLLQLVPDDLQGFAVKIPQKEYDENPSYYRFPLQYLYSLASHAEKSTYQFIESQTNLFCLLHEVKCGLMNANCRYMELQRLRAGEDTQVVEREMNGTREDGGRTLTEDLKEKVGMVEQQWAEALGKIMDDVKQRVQQWIVKEGGWEEMVQME